LAGLLGRFSMPLQGCLSAIEAPDDAKILDFTAPEDSSRLACVAAEHAVWHAGRAILNESDVLPENSHVVGLSPFEETDMKRKQFSVWE